MRLHMSVGNEEERRRIYDFFHMNVRDSGPVSTTFNIIIEPSNYRKEEKVVKKLKHEKTERYDALEL